MAGAPAGESPELSASIGGGEPYACDYLEEAAKCFVDAGLQTRVLTNGVGVSEERLRKTVEYGVKSFSISLDSLYPARFDYICEKPGSWDDAVRSMSLISRLLAETPGGLINAIGLQGVGVEAFAAKVLPKLRRIDTAVIVNVCGADDDEYAAVVEFLDGLKVI